MKYMGSKASHAKHIVPIIKYYQNDMPYWEPFVGGGNIIEHISGERMGSDLDADLISMWQAVSKGWLPPKLFNENDYKEIKKSQTSPLRGYAAFALSYGGKKFGGWCRDSAGKRNYVDEAYRNAIKQFPKMKEVKFYLGSYADFEVKNTLIYCDPPYAGTTKYASNFDSEKFWEWARYMSRFNTVLVSEYEAPSDFDVLWAKKVSSSLTRNTGDKEAVERLFKVKK